MKLLSKSIGLLLPILTLAATASAADGQAADAVPLIWYIAPVASILALLFAIFFYKKVMAEPEGNEKMIEMTEKA